MKKISVFQIILLAVFGALAIAGILIFAFAVGGGSSTSTIGKVVIWGTFDQATFTSVLGQAAQSDQNLAQVSYVQKDASTFEQDLSQALAQQSGPNLFILPSDDALQDEGEISTIPFSQLSEAQFQTIFAEAADPYLATSSILAIPFAVDPLVLYWNRDLLSSAGYAEPPTTWDQVPAMVQAITVKDDTGAITTSGIALGTYDNIENAKAILSALIMQVGVSITAYTDAGGLTSTLSSSAGTDQPAQDALSYYTEFANPAQSDYSWNDSIQSARASFAAGDVALYVGYASEKPLITSMNPNLDFAVAPLPQLKGASYTSDYGRAYAFAIPRANSNFTGAYETAQLLDSASTTAAFAQAFSIASVRRDALAKPASGDQDIFNKMAIITRIWSDPDPTQTDGLFRAMIEDTVSGAATLPQALESAQEQMTQIIDSEKSNP